MKRYHRLFAGILSCCLAASAVMFGSTAPVFAETSSENALENAEIILCGINDLRVEAGLNELKFTPELLSIAQKRAEELAVLYSHDRPDGTNAADLLSASGIPFSLWGEANAGRSSKPLAILSGWVNSELHQEILLEPEFTHLGIGFYYDSETSRKYHWCLVAITSNGVEGPTLFPGQYVPKRECGDVNGSKSVNATDAARILTYAVNRAAGLDYPTATGFKEAADVNGDGSINSKDASIILTYSAELGTNPDATLQSCIW